VARPGGFPPGPRESAGSGARLNGQAPIACRVRRGGTLGPVARHRDNSVSLTQFARRAQSHPPVEVVPKIPSPPGEPASHCARLSLVDRSRLIVQAQGEERSDNLWCAPLTPCEMTGDNPAPTETAAFDSIVASGVRAPRPSASQRYTHHAALAMKMEVGRAPLTSDRTAAALIKPNQRGDPDFVDERT
jgi:hypothetical protein